MRIRTVLVAVAAMICVGMTTQAVNAQGPLANNLFAQYTTRGANMTDAGMYPAPHWVPSQMGHTYYTYQPLMPHEMMYTHSRNYYNWYAPADQFYARKYGHHSGGAGLTKTTVRWQSGCSHMAPLPGNMWPFAGLHYKIAAHKYCLKSGGKGCHRLLGGCKGGSCGCGQAGCETCAAEVYGGEFYPAAPGCATGGCAAKAPNRRTIGR